MRPEAGRPRAPGRAVRVAVAACAVWVLGAGGASAATVTVGSPLTQSFTPTTIGHLDTIMNLGLSEPEAHAASPISGTIVRWRVLGAAGGPFRLRVLRFLGNPGLTGTGTSGPETPTGLGVQTFATKLPIQAGELIGIDNSATTDMLGLAEGLPVTAAIAVWDPPLADGSTRVPTDVVPNDEAAFNADVQPPPSVSSISPRSGPSTGGSAVTIAGSDFNGVSAVDFGGNPAASYSVNSESQIVANSPAVSPGPVDVTVTTVAGKSATGSADVFTFIAPPAPVARKVCRVPKLKHRTLRSAKRVLRKRHCRLGKVRGRRSKNAVVKKQHPRPRTVLPRGGRVSVKVGPRPRRR